MHSEADAADGAAGTRPTSEAQLKAGLASAGELSNVLRGLLHKLKSGIVEISSFGQLQARSDALKAEWTPTSARQDCERCAQ